MFGHIPLGAYLVMFIVIAVIAAVTTPAQPPGGDL